MIDVCALFSFILRVRWLFFKLLQEFLVFYKKHERFINIWLMVVLTGIRRYGKDFMAIADVIGNKTEAHIRSFFVNYRRRYNLDEVLDEYEKEHGGINHKRDDVEVSIMCMHLLWLSVWDGFFSPQLSESLRRRVVRISSRMENHTKCIFSYTVRWIYLATVLNMGGMSKVYEKLHILLGHIPPGLIMLITRVNYVNYQA